MPRGLRVCDNNNNFVRGVLAHLPKQLYWLFDVMTISHFKTVFPFVVGVYLNILYT